MEKKLVLSIGVDKPNATEQSSKQNVLYETQNRMLDCFLVITKTALLNNPPILF